MVVPPQEMNIRADGKFVGKGELQVLYQGELIDIAMQYIYIPGMYTIIYIYDYICMIYHLTIHSIRFPDVANPNYVASKSEFVIPKPGDDGDEDSIHLSGLPRGQSSLVILQRSSKIHGRSMD